MELYYNGKLFELEDDLKTTTNSYEITEEIGSGGNAVVYECIDRAGNYYAVKFLLRFTKVASARFNQEIKLLRQFNNPHIVRYIDNGTITIREKVNGQYKQHVTPFLIMEKADSNLLKYLRNNEDVPYNVYIAQFRGLCEALMELHNKAVHRDIKPENILIKGERWILSDFGLCSAIDDSLKIDLTKENEKVGPKFWISPEAANKFYFGDNVADKIDTYSDVYQLCSVFIFVINKKYPGGIFATSDIKCPLEQLCKLLISGLSYDPQARPTNGKELYDELNAIIPA
ncbi:MAG: serine/threonine protein kinase [Clostridiales bacterium]|nr:serine/threonine protein kinase [Clostridiales bacterium]